MPGEAGDYLYAAISQTWFVFAKVMKGVSPYDAANFLEDLRKNARCDPRLRHRQSSVRFQHQGGWDDPQSTFSVRAAVAAVSWNRRSRITTSWSRTFKISAIAAAFLLLTRSVLSTRARPDTRLLWRANQKDIILLKIVIACGYFDCPLGIA